MGKYFRNHFVASYQKVGTFRIVNGQKQGGNVAGYFCTPDGRVLHAIAGPVDAGVLLREARWAVEADKLARLEAGDDGERLRDFFRQAHAERLRREHGLNLDAAAARGSCPTLTPPGRVHLLLAVAPLARVDQVYRLVFEKILGEKVSVAPVVERST